MHLLFEHHTAIQITMKDDIVYFGGTDLNIFAWGDGDETTKQRKARAIQMGIQTPTQNYSQPRVTRYFNLPENVNHPMRNFFGIT